MISVDQIYLLQKKVESAVQKIEQLKTENDALRTKCSELTNALSEKTELLSSFTADEKKIEDGIMNALNRLDSVENSILDNAGQKAAAPAPSQSAPVAVSVNAPAPTEQSPAQPVQVTVNVQTTPAQQPVEVVEPIQQPFEEQSVEPEPEPTIATTEEGSFFGLNPDEGDSLFGDTSFETEEDNSTQDIF